MNHFVSRKYIYTVIFSLLLCFHARGQDLDSEVRKLSPFFQALANFSEKVPYEKVYLHFDNTSYYQGDNIWFKCYVAASGLHQLSPFSKTLYVELLNPGGEIIDNRILKIEDGQCHGDFSLNHLPFYSGFYEVRAYTKYMLNFGDDLIFSRLLPVFNKPKKEGDYEEKKMLKYGPYGPAGNYPMKRERPEKGKSVNVRFFPEGGNPVQGVPSRIAFEATDETGNPVEVMGVVTDDTKQELCRFASQHEGRGIFTYTPSSDKQKAIAEVNYSGKKYRFDLPAALPSGIVMEVDNISYPDSIGISLRKNMETPAGIFGVVVLSGGNLQDYLCIMMDFEEINFKIDKTGLPPGISQIVLFNGKGEILCDRLAFTGKNDFLEINAKTDKQSYRPYEPVEMEFLITDKDTNPVNATFSLAVRDGENEVKSNHTILTDLLLMSEIKGYVSNPSWYFEGDDDIRSRELDVLLMVQGWRRYSWNRMAGIEPFEVKYLPEQGIEIHGRTVSYRLFSNKQVPQPNVDVDLFLLQRGEEDDETGGSFIKSFVTDDEGRFSFTADVAGKWNMILTVTEKGKPKDHTILLDRVFSPEPKKYSYTDLQINIAGNNPVLLADDEETPEDPEDDYASFLAAYQDSLVRSGIDEKIHPLPEVTVKANIAQKIFNNRSKSVAYYDVASELDDIHDRGIYIGNSLYELMMNMNKNFYLNDISDLILATILPKPKPLDFKIKAALMVLRMLSQEDFITVINGESLDTIGGNTLYYKNKLPLFVVNHEDSRFSGEFLHRTFSPSAIKSIYINENPVIISEYLKVRTEAESMEATVILSELTNKYGCVVFIETYPEGQIPVGGAKGVRKTWLEGYSPVKEFYSPDYTALPQESDYRRTLYWNPMVIPDENGIAKIAFFNNGSCRNFSISAETVTSQGKIGIYKDK